MAEEYVAFIALLGSLFVIAGGILIRGDLRATPAVNTAFLAIGAVLANLIGTTGASMLLIRPLLETNSERKRISHIPIFFIFLVSNIGGCLTPLGDPPLFLGFLEGVPFAWTLRLFPEWAFMVASLLVIFYFVDRRAVRHETTAALRLDRERIRPLAHERGAQLPLPARRAAGRAPACAPSSRACASHGGHGRRQLPHHQAGDPPREPLLVLPDQRGGDRLRRHLRHHGAGAPHPRGARGEPGDRQAVAVLLAHGRTLLVPGQRPDLSDLLAAGRSACPGLAPEPPGPLSVLVHHETGAALLRAISLGAVFMGANTYIGNGPNFMVKTIAEHRRIRMPSFFGYMLWSVGILVPLFLLVTVIFLL